MTDTKPHPTLEELSAEAAASEAKLFRGKAPIAFRIQWSGATDEFLNGDIVVADFAGKPKSCDLVVVNMGEIFVLRRIYAKKDGGFFLRHVGPEGFPTEEDPTLPMWPCFYLIHSLTDKPLNYDVPLTVQAGGSDDR